jgi:predicted metal-binding membrane protein
VKADRFAVIAALVFITSAAVTIAWCGSMSRMPGMDMPGGWVMSMAWMRMPGQGWLESAGNFIGMWTLMMVAMMLPVLAPQLARYRRTVPVPDRNALTACMAGGYFTIWILSGVLLYPVGMAFAEMTMAAPGISAFVPSLGAGVVVAAGVAQFSAWKDRQLASCCHSVDCARGAQARVTGPDAASAWRQGMNLGLRCFYCCASLTAVLLVIGVMDLRAMALVTMAISAERLMPARMRVARAVGMALIFMGVAMFLRAN